MNALIRGRDTVLGTHKPSPSLTGSASRKPSAAHTNCFSATRLALTNPSLLNVADARRFGYSGPFRNVVAERAIPLASNAAVFTCRFGSPSS